MWCSLWACRDALPAPAFGSSEEGVGGTVPSKHRHSRKGRRLQPSYYRKCQPVPRSTNIFYLFFSFWSCLNYSLSRTTTCSLMARGWVVPWRTRSPFIPRCHRCPGVAATGGTEGMPCSRTGGNWAPCALSREGVTLSTKLQQQIRPPCLLPAAITH